MAPLQNLSLFVVSGPSGAGKTLLCHRILKKYPQLFSYSISTTTRSPRGQEKEGEEYHFTDVETFKKQIEAGEFLEWAEVHENYYGTPKKNLKAASAAGKALILNIDVVGAQKIKSTGIPGIFIFISPPTLEVLESRLRKRGLEKEASLKKRLQNARQEIQTNHWYDFILVNDVLDDALSQFETILLNWGSTEPTNEFY